MAWDDAFADYPGAGYLITAARLNAIITQIKTYLSNSGAGNGKIPIGKTDGTFNVATLTAGANVTITNGDGTISIAAASGGASFWTALTATTDFATTGASTSTITMNTDQTAIIPVGSPIKFTLNGTVYYAKCTALAANLMTIRGAPLDTTAGHLTAVSWGDSSRITKEPFVISVPGYYEDADNATLLATDLSTYIKWTAPKAYCIGYDVISKVHDSHATHGKVTVLINATDLNTAADGLTIAADATWYSTVVDIATAAYDINPTEMIEIAVKKGGNGDAHDLTVELIFVYP